MLKSILTFLLMLLLMFSAVAEVPQTINYQGMITDNAGDPVVDGNYLVNFAIFDAAVGGTQLWASGFQNLTATDGLIAYELGSSVVLPDDLFTDTLLYLGITVGADPELTPRSRLQTVPFSYHALRADTAGYIESTTGVTQGLDEGDNVITGFLNLTIEDSINCPADGFVMINLSLGMNCNHTNSDNDVVFVLLTDSTATILQDQDNRAWSLPTSLPTGFYGTYVHLHKVFPVSAGWNKFLGLAFQNAGGGTDNFSWSDPAMSLLFIPNSYGNVSEGMPTPPNSDLNTKPKKF